MLGCLRAVEQVNREVNGRVLAAEQTGRLRELVQEMAEKANEEPSASWSAH